MYLEFYSWEDAIAFVSLLGSYSVPYSIILEYGTQNGTRVTINVKDDDSWLKGFFWGVMHHHRTMNPDAIAKGPILQ